MSFTLIVALALAIIAGTSHAQTQQYVTDVCEVTLRTGQSTSHRIVKILPSGAQVEVLQSEADSGYSQVRTEEGTEGWILSRFLMEEPPARQQLLSYQDKIANIDAIEAQLNERIAELEQLQEATGQQLASVERERDWLASELEQLQRAAADPIALSNENADLRYQLELMREEKAALANENQRLQDDTAKEWFIRGAGVAGAGLLAGLVLPYLRLRRRRDSWRTL